MSLSFDFLIKQLVLFFIHICGLASQDLKKKSTTWTENQVQSTLILNFIVR